MNKRNWLIFEDTRQTPEARAAFDRAVAQVNDGTAQVRKLSGESIRGFVVDGQKILGQAVLEYVLEGLSSASRDVSPAGTPVPPCGAPAAPFDAESARAFAERMRLLLGWHDIDYLLHRWVDRRLRDPHFVNKGNDWREQWVLKEGADPAVVSDGLFRFACYVAICDLKFGPSYASVSAERIFNQVTQLGSDLPARLKRDGTGELPGELAAFRGAGMSAKANDALAVIRITVQEESEAAYAQALGYLDRLLSTTDFPRSYAIEFRGPTKTYLPIKGLPKKGVHQLFACAAAYPALHPAIEAYARRAMREYEWYTNLDAEDCAMPGSFAVFALGCASAAHAPLVLDYLALADGEHQSMHGRYVEGYLDAHGFTREAIAYLLACAGNIQHLRHRKTYAERIANADSLGWLLEARRRVAGDAPSSIAALRANLLGERVDEAAFRAARHAIWGEQADKDRGGQVIRKAPEALRALYTEIFADEPGR